MDYRLENAILRFSMEARTRTPAILREPQDGTEFMAFAVLPLLRERVGVRGNADCGT